MEDYVLLHPGCSAEGNREAAIAGKCEDVLIKWVLTLAFDTCNKVDSGLSDKLVSSGSVTQWQTGVDAIEFLFLFCLQEMIKTWQRIGDH